MRTIEKYLIAFYFLICPIEIALHLVVTSTAKYAGLMILLTEGCILLSRRKNMDVNFSFGSAATLFWIAYSAITVIWANTNSLTFEYLTTYAMMGALLFACTMETWNEAEIDLFVRAYLIGSILMAFTVIFFGGGGFSDRETIIIMGSECDPNQVAANIVPGAMLSFDRFFGEKTNRKTKIISLASFVLCTYSIFQTGSRGGFAALALGVAYLLFVAFRKGAVKIWMILLAVVVGAVSVSYIPVFTEGRVLDFGSYNATYSNQLNRVIIWQKLLSTFDEQWIWGHGVGSTVNYLERAIGKVTAVHNTFLHVLFEVGFAGFSLFIFPYVTMIRRYYKKNGALVSVLLGAMVCSFFLDALNLRYLWNGLMLCIMQYHFDIYGQEQETLPQPQASPRPVCKYIRDY